MYDRREKQGTLDVGDDAATTADRTGEVWGSEGFQDDRKGKRSEPSQADLFGTSEEIEGQGTLFGDGVAKVETSTPWESSGSPSPKPLLSDVERRTSAFEAAVVARDVPAGFEELWGAHSESQSRNDPDRGNGKAVLSDLDRIAHEAAQHSIDQNIEAASAAGVLDGPNGDMEHAPPDVLRGDKVRLEFHRREDAQEARALLSDGAETGRFDGRHKSVEFYADAVDERTAAEVRGIAADSLRHKRDQAGQVPITPAERKRLKKRGGGYNEFHARSAKAIMLHEGVDDWTAYYDSTLSVDEHRGIARTGDARSGGVRYSGVSEELENIEREARAQNRIDAEEERHMRKGAARGNQDAIDALVNIAGWDRSKAEALALDAKDGKITEQRFREIVKTELERSIRSGRVVPMDTRPDKRVRGVDRGPGGRFVPDSSNRRSAGLYRRTSTGAFARRDD